MSALVHAHAECDRRHHDGAVRGHEPLLHGGTPVVLIPAWWRVPATLRRGRRRAPGGLLQAYGTMWAERRASRPSRVSSARAGPDRGDEELQVRAVEAGAHRAPPDREDAADVVEHWRGGRGGEGEDALGADRRGRSPRAWR